MKWLDLPPIWTAGFAVLTWLVPIPAPWGAFPISGGLVLVLAGVLLVAAIFEFARAKTTVIPHQRPTALITGGIFRLSRNPIYLADLLILVGLSLIWGRPLGLALVPVLGLVLARRFIGPEEARLRTAFGNDWTQYAASTRRWL